MNAIRTVSNRLAAPRATYLSPLALLLLFVVGIAAASESDETAESDRVQPTAAERQAFKHLDSQSNMEMRLAATPATVQQQVKPAKRLLNKIVKPIQATWAELSHPGDIVKFAQHLFRSDSPIATWADNFSDNPFLRRPISVMITSAPEFSMTSVIPSSSAHAGGMSLNRYVDAPVLNDTYESTMSQHTTTQLQVRMRRDWTMLYEFKRTNSAVFRDDVGVGLGLKHSF